MQQTNSMHVVPSSNLLWHAKEANNPALNLVCHFLGAQRGVGQEQLFSVPVDSGAASLFHLERSLIYPMRIGALSQQEHHARSGLHVKAIKLPMCSELTSHIITTNLVMMQFERPASNCLICIAHCKSYDKSKVKARVHVRGFQYEQWYERTTEGACSSMWTAVNSEDTPDEALYCLVRPGVRKRYPVPLELVSGDRTATTGTTEEPSKIKRRSGKAAWRTLKGSWRIAPSPSVQGPRQWSKGPILRVQLSVAVGSASITEQSRTAKKSTSTCVSNYKTRVAEETSALQS
eukprot:scaffold1076_cov37-Prasinocladus_malaysianus.AAC.1